MDPKTKYTEEDSKQETGASDSEQYNAWHTARDDFVNTFGNGTRESLDPSKNSDGYENAFGEVSKDLS